MKRHTDSQSLQAQCRGCFTFPIEDHLVVFRPQNRQLFVLNPTARWIWEARGRDKKPHEIASDMAAHFQMPSDIVLNHIEQTLSQWSTTHLNPAQVEGSEVTDILCETVTQSICVQPDDPACFQGHYRMGAVPATIHLHTPELTPLLEPLLSGLKVADQVKNADSENRIEVIKDQGQYVVVHNGIEVERSHLQHRALGGIIQSLIQCGYPESKWMAYIHGAAGAYEGRGVVLPGTGGSGKSTLMAALAWSGWQYWCDDIVPLQIDGKVRAVPLGICLKEGSWVALGAYLHGLEDHLAHHRYGVPVKYFQPDGKRINPADALPVDCLVFPRYIPDEPPSIKSLSPVEALRRLVEAQTWVSPHYAHVEALIQWIGKVSAHEMIFDSLNRGISFINRIVHHEAV
jgi:hypothetical protein